MTNILYKGRKIYTNISEDDLFEILLELAEKSYNGEIDANEIELEEI